MYDRLCNSDRRGFLKGAAGVLGGTAVTTLLKAQSQPSAGAPGGMFDGFKISKVQTTGATINVISSGQGPPVLLLHGNPQTHVMWHKIAPQLAREFTVVAADLRGSWRQQQTSGWRESLQLLETQHGARPNRSDAPFWV